MIKKGTVLYSASKYPEFQRDIYYFDTPLGAILHSSLDTRISWSTIGTTFGILYVDNKYIYLHTIVVARDLIDGPDYNLYTEGVGYPRAYLYNVTGIIQYVMKQYKLSYEEAFKCAYSPDLYYSINNAHRFPCNVYQYMSESVLVPIKSEKIDTHELIRYSRSLDLSMELTEAQHREKIMNHLWPAPLKFPRKIFPPDVTFKF